MFTLITCRDRYRHIDRTPCCGGWRVRSRGMKLIESYQVWCCHSCDENIEHERTPRTHGHHISESMPLWNSPHGVMVVMDHVLPQYTCWSTRNSPIIQTVFSSFLSSFSSKAVQTLDDANCADGAPSTALRRRWGPDAACWERRLHDKGGERINDAGRHLPNKHIAHQTRQINSLSKLFAQQTAAS